MDASKLIAMDWRTLLLAVVVMALAAYLGAYLGERGRQTATKEAIDLLVEQARKTTHVTEEVKSAIAGGMWVGQERWKLKVSTYERLIVALMRLEGLLEPYYDTDPPNYPALTAAGEEEFRELLRELEGANALAALWLPTEVAQAVRFVQGADRYADAGSREDVYKAVYKARKLLLVTVKDNLSLGS